MKILLRQWVAATATDGSLSRPSSFRRVTMPFAFSTFDSTPCSTWFCLVATKQGGVDTYRVVVGGY